MKEKKSGSAFRRKRGRGLSPLTKLSVSCSVFFLSHTLLPTATLVCHTFPSHNVFLFKWEVNIDKSPLQETFVGAGQSSMLTPRILSPDWTGDESLLPVDLFSSHKVQVLRHVSSVLDTAQPTTPWPYPPSCMQTQLGPLSFGVHAHWKLSSENDLFDLHCFSSLKYKTGRDHIPQTYWDLLAFHVQWPQSTFSLISCTPTHKHDSENGEKVYRQQHLEMIWQLRLNLFIYSAIGENYRRAFHPCPNKTSVLRESGEKRATLEENHGATQQGEYGFSTEINLSIIFASNLLWRSATSQKQTELWEKETKDDLPRSTQEPWALKPSRQDPQSAWVFLSSQAETGLSVVKARRQVVSLVGWKHRMDRWWKLM